MPVRFWLWKYESLLVAISTGVAGIGLAVLIQGVHSATAVDGEGGFFTHGAGDVVWFGVITVPVVAVAIAAGALWPQRDGVLGSEDRSFGDDGS